MDGFSLDVLGQVVGGILTSTLEKLRARSGEDRQRNEAARAVKEATARYTQELTEELAEVRILNLGTPRRLDSFFVRPAVTPRGGHSFSADELQRLLAGAPLDEPIDASNQLQPGARIVLLGPPGAGKSTFLQYVARRAVLGVTDQRLPLFLRLREVVASGHTLSGYATHLFNRSKVPLAEQFFRSTLEEGKLALLIDGLDEVPGSKVRAVTQEIRDLSATGSGNLVVVSCRDGVYDGWLGGFTELTLQPFTPIQIREFVDGWFASKPSTAQRCLKQLESSDAVRAIVSTPLLLALFCLRFEDNREIAPRQAEFVPDAIDVLLRRWDASREVDRDDSPISGCSASANAYRSISVSSKEELLALIAAQEFPDGPGIWRQGPLEQAIEEYFRARRFRSIGHVVDGRCVLAAMESQHGLLVRRSKDTFGFSHFRFYEYFAARHVARNPDRTEWLIREALLDRRWHDVVVYVAGATTTPDLFIESLLNATRRRPASSVASSVTECIRLMNSETPYTPVGTRWSYFASWLLRLAPLASRLDLAYRDFRELSDLRHTALLSKLAPLGSRHGSIIRQLESVPAIDTNWEWSDESFEASTHTLKRTGAPSLRESLHYHRLDLDKRVEPGTLQAQVRAQPKGEMVDHPSFTAIREMGRSLRDYLYLWEVLWQSVLSTDAVSEQAFSLVATEHLASFKTLSNAIE